MENIETKNNMSEFALRELKQEIRSASIKQHRVIKKHYWIMLISIIVIGVIVSASSVFVVNYVITQEYEMQDKDSIKSHYVIQNLKGDTISTWLSWRLAESEALYINVLGTEKFPQKIDIIRDIIYSEDVYEIDDSLTGKGPAGSTSLYYPGWTGALKAASVDSTIFHIPTNFEIIESDNRTGDIIIKLVSYESADGYKGFTKSISDQNQNQMLKSEITIYDVDNLTDEQFSTIVRHELGHAFGLMHTTASEDLMAEDIIDEFPYISECNVDAISRLYNNERLGTVTCEK